MSPFQVAHKQKTQLTSAISSNTGFGAYNFYIDAMSRRDLQILEEEKRMARNRQLMDAYGNKESLEDVQQALDAYEVR